MNNTSALNFPAKYERNVEISLSEKVSDATAWGIVRKARQFSGQDCFAIIEALGKIDNCFEKNLSRSLHIDVFSCQHLNECPNVWENMKSNILGISAKEYLQKSHFDSKILQEIGIVPPKLPSFQQYKANLKKQKEITTDNEQMKRKIDDFIANEKSFIETLEYLNNVQFNFNF